ncbi:hypothetical protein Q3G72_020866 [Acer saccharum]|nr:hypothetical protein Q3G72_020866 [Acer saccharum]
MGSASSPLPKEVESSEKWRDANSSRQAKWWYSTFHAVTAMIGAGVLSLPYAMAYLGCRHVTKLFYDSLGGLLESCYQVYAMPVFDMLERMIMKKLNFPPGLVLRLVVRSAYVGQI